MIGDTCYYKYKKDTRKQRIIHQHSKIHALATLLLVESKLINYLDKKSLVKNKFSNYLNENFPIMFAIHFFMMIVFFFVKNNGRSNS